MLVAMALGASSWGRGVLIVAAIVCFASAAVAWARGFVIGVKAVRHYGWADGGLAIALEVWRLRAEPRDPERGSLVHAVRRDGVVFVASTAAGFACVAGLVLLLN
jgi:hypothetical protein